MRKLKHTDFMKLVKTHITSKWQVWVGMRGWSSEPSGLAPVLGTQFPGLSLTDDWFL